jgi:hypothetical protein
VRELEQKRVEKLAAKRMLLKQLRQSGGAWSDGQSIHRGEQLEKLRHETLGEIMKLKEKDFATRKGPWMALNCQNLKVLHKHRLNPDSNTIGRKKSESTVDWFQRVLKDFSSNMQTSSQNRTLTFRRLLRRADRAAWEALPERIRCHQMELDKKFASRSAHSWELSQQVHMGNGVILPAGMDVYPTEGGFFTPALGQGQIIEAENVRKSSLTPRQANTPDKQYEHSQFELS